MSKRIAKSRRIKAVYPTREFLRDLYGFLAPYRGELLLASLARFTGDVVNLYPQFALASLVTFISAWHKGAPITMVYWWVASFYVAVITRQFAVYVGKTRGFAASQRAALDVRENGMARLFRLDIAWHERENSGNKLKRIDNGAAGIVRIVVIWINNVIEITVTLLGALVILAAFDPFVSAASVAFLAVYMPVSMRLRRASSIAAREVNAEEEQLDGALFESINNIRTAKVLDIAHALQRIIRQAAAKTYAKIRVRIRIFQSTNMLLGVLSTTFRAIALLYIVHGIFIGRFEIGFLLLFHGYFNRLTDAAVELSDVAQEAAIARHSLNRMMDLYRAPVVDPGTKEFPRDWKVISLRNVGYSYGGKPVLRGVTFDIHRGERVGVVGLSGAGKSTLFKLLLKELEDYSGEILVDGMLLRDIRKDFFYRHAAVVLQETEVFNFSLRKNIAIAARGRKDDAAALRRAVETSYVTDFLKRLPEGLETQIGEKGVKLSGGERQRVGIARAIFKRPDILFLDEATSHLDLKSEERIRDSLHAFFKTVTAVVIAHRLTTIKEMDRIVVLENGRLIEQGSFASLHAARGRFHELWEMQKLGARE